MKNPTEQKIWQTAYDGVVGQGALAKEADGFCAYRIGELKCGVGHLISDDEADLMGTRSISTAISMGLAPDWMRPFWSFLIDIQVAHDEAYGIDGFKRNMDRIKPETET